MPKKKSVKKMGRPSTRPHGAKKLQVYFAPETYADLKAGNVRFAKPMTTLVEEQVAAWAEANRRELDETKRALKRATGG